MKRFYLFVITIMLIGCSNNNAVDIPDTILPKQKMAEVMVDVHLMEASMNTNGGYNPARKMEVDMPSVSLSIDILKRHSITKKQFDDSFSFYSSHPTLFMEVYDLVLNQLSQMQAVVNSKK